MNYRRIWCDVATSETCARLSKSAHLAWPLFVACATDSWGRCYDRSHSIRAAMFRARADFSEREIAQWIQEWEREGMIQRYTADGQAAIQVVNFEARQPDTVSYRRKVSEVEKIPSPPGYTPAAARGSRRQNDGKMTAKLRHTNDKMTANSQNSTAENPVDKNKDHDHDHYPPLPPANGGGAARILPEVAERAERLGGQPLSSADQTLLRRWLYSEKHPVAWILQACDDADEAGKPRLKYVDGILERYRNDGGPRQRAACARQREKWVDPLPELPL